MFHERFVPPRVAGRLNLPGTVRFRNGRASTALTLVGARRSSTADDVPDVAAHGAPVRRLLLIWVPLLAVVTLYVAGTVIMNAPESPAKRKLAATVNHAMAPWFSQNWFLFAPDAPTAHYPTYLQARIIQPGQARATESGPLDVTALALRRSHGGVLARGEFKDITVGFLKTVYNNPSLINSAPNRSGDPTSARRAPARPNDEIRMFQDSFQRYLSSEAARTYPNARVLAVRGWVGYRMVVPRWGSGASAAGGGRVYDSGWLPYVPGVARP